MLVEIENIKYYDETVGCETRKINSEINIPSIKIKIDNKEYLVNFELKDMKDSDTECEIRMIAKNDDLNLTAQSDIIDTQLIIKDMYQSIIENKEIESSKLFLELKEQTCSLLFKDLAKESLIEGVSYNNTVILKVSNEAIGTATGFLFKKDTIKLNDIDLITDIETTQSLKGETFISPNKKVLFSALYLGNNEFELTDIETLNEKVDEKLIDQKQESDFDTREDYMEYRRSLIVKDLTDKLYEFDFDDLF